MRKKLIILIIFAVAMLLIVFIGLFLSRGSRSYIGPLYQFSQQLEKRRIQEGKGIRVYLKRDVPDEEGDLVRQRFSNISGVNGTSFISKSAQEVINDKASLYPKEIDSLISGSHIIIDVYVENIQNKEAVIQQLKKDSRVEVIIDLEAQ